MLIQTEKIMHIKGAFLLNREKNTEHFMKEGFLKHISTIIGSQKETLLTSTSKQIFMDGIKGRKRQAEKLVGFLEILIHIQLLMFQEYIRYATQE